MEGLYRNFKLSIVANNDENVALHLVSKKNATDGLILIDVTANMFDKYHLLVPSSVPNTGEPTNILLYNPINSNMMRFYPVLHECFTKSELEKLDCLVIATNSGFLEAIMYYNHIVNMESKQNSFFMLQLSYMDDVIPSYINKSMSDKAELKKRYVGINLDYVLDQEKTRIYSPSIFEELGATIKSKYNMVCIDVTPTSVRTVALKLKQITYASILFGLQSLSKGGSIVCTFSFANFDTLFLKELTYMMLKFFTDVSIFSSKAQPYTFFVVFKGYLQISDREFLTLFSGVTELYKLDKSGGTSLGYSDDTINGKYGLVPETKTSTDVFPVTLFDFKFTKEYEGQFDTIVSRARDIQILLDGLAKPNAYNIKEKSPELDLFLSKYSIIQLKANIRFAKKYGLQIKPKYLDYDKSYEQKILKDLFTVDRSIIHPFTRYHKGCSLRYEKGASYSYIVKEIYAYKKKLLIHKFYLDTINAKKWDKVAYRTNLPYYIRKYIEKTYSIPKVTRAFLKLYEILHDFPNLTTSEEGSTVNFLHICEAPGKFIDATNYFVKVHTNKGYKWNANSLNPFSGLAKQKFGSMFGDEYGYMRKYPKNWLFGADGTGDITSVANLKNIVAAAKKNLGKVHVITSDCGLSVEEDYNEQELKLSVLHLAQTICALLVLEKGGHAVLKVFIPHAESISISLMYLLYCTFTRVSFVKQLSGSPISSEIYIVCENLKHVPSQDLMDYLLDFLQNYKQGSSLWPIDQYPEDFLKQYEQFIGDFVKKQVRALSATYFYYDYPELLEKHNLKIDRYKEERALNYSEVMNYKHIDRSELL